MRVILSLIIIIQILIASGQLVNNSNHNFGKVANWNNPIYEAEFTNLSSKTQYFLPVRYDRDVRISYGKSSLSPGESTTIQIQYFTEEVGRFRKSVPIYVSTQEEPIMLSMRGVIKSIHPDAYTVCPRIENSGTRTALGFVHIITVIDEQTGEILTDYDLEIITPNSQESIEVVEKKVELKRNKPQLYFFQIDKEGYEVAKEKVYVQRNTKETTFYLKKKEVEEDPEYFDFNDTAKIDEEIVEVITEVPQRDTTTVEEVIITEIDTADFIDGGTLNEKKYAFNHIIFLIDISTSMKKEDKLPLLKQSMNQMINVLRPQDKVSIITYSTETIVVADQISGGEKEKLKQLVASLEARGNSYGKEAVDIAYKQAKENFITEGNNEIILASDGVFNSKNFNEKKMYRGATLQYSLYNVRLSTIGFGNTSRALKFLETLAEKGRGSYIEIRTEEEAKTTLITNLMRHSKKM